MHHSFHNITHQPGAGAPTIFLPGWGFDGRILHLVKPLPNWIYPGTFIDPACIREDLLAFFPTENIRKARLVGWSMGAMVGLEFAAAYEDLIDSLVLVSLRNHWPGHEVEAILAEFSHDPETFLKGFYRKCFLGDKQAYRNFQTRLEPLYLSAIKTNSEQLYRGLHYLAAFALPGRAPKVPTRLIHGRQDIIAPLADMVQLPGAEVEVIDNTGHFVFQQEGSSLQYEFRKRSILMKFSKAAGSYDDYARVQTDVARKLAAKLPAGEKKSKIRSILEIGCGTGNFTALLASCFPKAKITAIDFSPEMLAIARHKLPDKRVDFVCAEGERFLQEAPGKSYDLVVSNGALQWFADIDKALAAIARILTADGFMYCAIFGPQSLQELGEGLSAIQVFPQNLAARSFPSQARIQKALHRYLQAGTIETELTVKEYDSAHDLLLHLKKTGTSGWQQKMRQPLTPSRVKELDAWFQRTYGACRVTYQVLFLQGRK